MYFNRSGGEFSDPIAIRHDPGADPRLGTAVNMSGQTRAGLLWNSPRGRGTGYVQLEFGQACSGQPADHGSTTERGWFPSCSTGGRWRTNSAISGPDSEWATNLPFPLAVVAGSRETDHVSGQVTETEYRYHEGHFQPRTRQFQGFRKRRAH